VKRAFLACLAVGSAIISSSQAATAFTAATPDKTGNAASFVRKLYADQARQHPEPTWWHYLAARPHTLLKHVQRVQAKTGDSVIDEDWLCQCQDTGGLKVTSVALAPSSAMAVTATVHLTAPASAPYAVTLKLVNEGGWKIAEIVNSQGQTFTAFLENGLKSYPNVK
jgi:hypothetical protein